MNSPEAKKPAWESLPSEAWTFESTESVRIHARTFFPNPNAPIHIIVYVPPTPYPVSIRAQFDWGADFSFAAGPHFPPLLLSSHATGFCKEVYHHLIEDMYTQRLPQSVPVTSFDFRGHGDSASLAYQSIPWHQLATGTINPEDATKIRTEKLEVRPTGSLWLNATDLLFLCDQIKRKSADPNLKFYGFGHSMGALVTCAAQILRPGLFSRAFLIEPVIFPINSLGRGKLPLITAALKRKPGFASFAEAQANFQGRGIFENFDPRCLRPFLLRSREHPERVNVILGLIDNYVHYGLREDRETGGVVLKCSPPWESQTFRDGEASGMWDMVVDRLHFPDKPAILVAGEKTTTYPPNFAALLATRAHATLYICPNTDHFLPMTHSVLTAKMVLDFFEMEPKAKL